MSESPSIEQLVGQMLMAGFEGEQAPDRLVNLLAERHLGGVALFSRNIASPQQVRDLTNAVIAAASDGCPIVAVDQEGGKVQRLREPFTRLPPARSLGRTNDVALAWKWGKLLATELRAVGVSLNFAPVADLDTNPDNPVIGERALGSDPEEVARLAMGWVMGMQQGGVAGCGKHFPGHGDTILDSHLDLPTVALPKRRIERKEFKPFKRLAKGGVASMMGGHLMVPKLDPDRPASLSKILLDDRLRKELGFAGVVITDDLEMKAIDGRYEMETILGWGLEAEVDIFLFCHTLAKVERAMDILLDWAREGRVSRARLARSYERIASLKAQFPASAEPLDARILGQTAHLRLVEHVLAFDG